MRVYPVGGGAPGIDPNSLTADPSDILYPKIGGVQGNYNGVQGTLQLTGNAQSNHVLSGETFYTNNAKSKQTGTMNVQSILSFSCASYSSNQIIFTWQNPQFGPFSGVIIVWKTGGYPANINDGNRFYKGYGNNANSLGMSSVITSGWGINTTYYFRIFSYCTVNNEEWIADNTFIGNVMIQQIIQIFNASTNWIVPNNVRFLDIFCVGGGGGGNFGSRIQDHYGGGGGGGGYTSQINNISVTPGQQLSIIVGSGGAERNKGEDTQVLGLILASGGGAGSNYLSGNGKGGNGGSGGGGGAFVYNSNDTAHAGNGGSNGSNGTYDPGAGQAGIGQGTTTFAFGNPSSTLFSGGGGGGGSAQFNNSGRGVGGSGGGGNGRDAGAIGSNGTPNSGGGGGGGFLGGGDGTGYSGGSGVCMIRYVV